MPESIYSLAYVYLLKGIHIEGELSDDGERNVLDDELDYNEKEEQADVTGRNS